MSRVYYYYEINLISVIYSICKAQTKDAVVFVVVEVGQTDRPLEHNDNANLTVGLRNLINSTMEKKSFGHAQHGGGTHFNDATAASFLMWQV